jgi:hypothetical protein
LLLLCDYVLSNPEGFNDLMGTTSVSKGQLTPESPTWLKVSLYLTVTLASSS